MDIDLQRALNSMSKEDKAVIELRFFEDLKLSEIAEILGENISTIKSRLYRGLKKMNLLKSQYEGTNMTNEQLESIKTVIAEAKQQKRRNHQRAILRRCSAQPL